MNNAITNIVQNVNQLIINGITHKQANRDILVRFYPNSSDRNNHRLMSVNSLRSELGDEFTVKFIEKFIELGVQKHAFKLRRGIEIVMCIR